jgi:hypothetical protein
MMGCIGFYCIISSEYLKEALVFSDSLRLPRLAAICKMSGCITTAILLPLCSELAGSENWKIYNIE